MAKEEFLEEEENQDERELHNWWDSIKERSPIGIKPRQREYLAAEVAVGMEPKLSENNRKQIQRDFKMYDAHTQEVISEKWPKTETDQARIYKTEWEDWEFCKSQILLYSAELKNHNAEIRKWYLWRNSFLKSLIRFRYIDFGNKFVLNIENLNEFEQMVLKIMNETNIKNPMEFWKIFALELKNIKYDKENILKYWEPDFGNLLARTLYWQTPRNDPRPVSYSTFQRKILPNIRKVKKIFTR